MSRAQNYEFQEWWNKQRQYLDAPDHHHHNNNSNGFLTVEIRSPTTPSSDPTVSRKGHNRSARQLSWLYLLKLQQLASSISSLASASASLLRTASRRLTTTTAASSSSSSPSRLYRIIRFFLIFVVVLLCLELVAYFKGWHFSPPSVGSAEAALERGYARWIEIRALYLAPPLQWITNVCVVLFLIQSVDRVVMVLGCFWIKFRKLKPVPAVEYVGGRREVKKEVEEEKEEDYPMVLVQIPMCNEREVS